MDNRDTWQRRQAAGTISLPLEYRYIKIKQEKDQFFGAAGVFSILRLPYMYTVQKADFLS
jgi:hypothetical protein